MIELTDKFTDKKESIKLLTDTTARCFDHEKVRLLYIAAQVARIDLKVDLAIAECMRIYRHTVRSAAASGFIPAGPSTTRVTVAAVVCKTIAACFGLPTVSPKTIHEIVNIVIWEDMGHDVSILVAEVISGVGITGTLALGGMPVFLAAGVINAPIVVPATTRLFLMLACDVILILVKAFKDSTDKCVGQPLRKDVEFAALEYRKISKMVHKKIKKVIPRRNMIKSFQANRVHEQFTAIVAEYKALVTEGIGQVKIMKPKDCDDDSDSDTTEAESKEQMKSLNVKHEELEAQEHTTLFLPRHHPLHVLHSQIFRLKSFELYQSVLKLSDVLTRYEMVISCLASISRRAWMVSHPMFLQQ